MKVSREVAREAAGWLSLIHSGEASAQEQQACLVWRQAKPEHELAWSRAEALQQKLGLLPKDVGLKTLDREQRQDRRQAIKALALLVVAGPLTYALYHTKPWQLFTVNYRTAIGEQRYIELADGTQVYLNTATALDVQFSAQQRLLVLYRGEILIATGPGTTSSQASQLTRPLLVQTAQGTMQPIGTRFMVRQLSKLTRLGVVAGEVRVQTANQRPQGSFAGHLLAGQQVDFSQDSMQPVQPLTQQADSWSRGRLYANNMPLGQFVQELARYRHGILRCDPAVAGLKISGVFQLDNTDQILAALPDTLPVAVHSRFGWWVNVTAR